MAPRRKRQRLSEDGASAAPADSAPSAEEPSHTTNQSPAKAAQQSRKQLFVRSLATTVTTEDLTEFFSENYPIKHALVVLDKETKESKGYGFVSFADAEDAQRAKDELDGTALKGKKIKIEVAEARHRDAGTSDQPSAGARVKAEREQAIKENQAPKLIVRNLPWSIKTPDQLEKLFLGFGKVHFAKLPKKPSGELRGFGFVAMRGKKNAEKALEDLNGKEVDGRQIAVDWAVDKETWHELQKTDEAQAGDENGDDTQEVKDEDNDEDSSDEGSDSEEEPSSDEDEDDSDADLEGLSDSGSDGGVELEEDVKPQEPRYTVFIRNLPFTADDDSLYEHFKQFGPVRYARVVLDHETERPKGTGFVCFYKEEDMINCLKGVPRTKLTRTTADRRDGTTITIAHSVLEDADADPSGKYTMDGRVLQISEAVEKGEATRLTAEGAASRFNRDKDKRRLYLLSEGTIDSKSTLYQQLSPSEIAMRQESATQRRKQIETNPSLHLSLTRLAVRNIPRNITSKDLKALARKAVVGFAADVKAGKRQKLSKEEVIRGGGAMAAAEKARKARGKGIVKQAKIVFETPTGSKIAEETGAGRSRGYGFIEYYTHRSALMALRWLNGHAVDYKAKADPQQQDSSTAPKSKKAAREEVLDKKKRLIVEFAIENANVVARRSDRESKSKDKKPRGADDTADGDDDGDAGTRGQGKGKGKRRAEDGNGEQQRGKKRKVDGDGAAGKVRSGKPGGRRGSGVGADAGEAEDKTRLRQKTQIIQRKRAMRKAKRQGGKGKA